MYKIIIMLITFNIVIFTYCSDLESIKNETEIIESIKLSDEYQKGLITILVEKTEYEIQLSHTDGFADDYLIILNTDSGEIIKLVELEQNTVSWKQIFNLPKGKYDIYYPAYIELFYSKSEGNSEFFQQSEVHTITLHAFDKNNNIIASASGSANTLNKAHSIAENYLKKSAPNAVTISEKKNEKMPELEELINYTLENGKIKDIIVNCKKLHKSKREEFVNEI